MTVPCEVSPDFWFSENAEDVAQAKEACGFCPVRSQCAELGQDEEFGVWGGQDPEDRRAQKRFRLLLLEEQTNARMRKMLTEGLSISAMARELNMPRKTVADRLRRMQRTAA